MVLPAGINQAEFVCHQPPFYFLGSIQSAVPFRSLSANSSGSRISEVSYLKYLPIYPYKYWIRSLCEDPFDDFNDPIASEPSSPIEPHLRLSAFAVTTDSERTRVYLYEAYSLTHSPEIHDQVTTFCGRIFPFSSALKSVCNVSVFGLLTYPC